MLYLGDCREILPTIGNVDAIVTDPPYGIGYQYESYDDSEDGWFSLIDDVVPLLRKSAPFVVMPSCKIARLPWWYANHSPDCLIAWHFTRPSICNRFQCLGTSRLLGKANNPHARSFFYSMWI